MLCTFESNSNTFINFQFSIFLEHLMNFKEFKEQYTNGTLPENYYDIKITN